MINPDICSCCGEIWNRKKLEIVNLGKNKLRLCPDCFKEYEAVLFGAFEAGYRKRIITTEEQLRAEPAMDRAIELLEQEPKTGHWIDTDRDDACWCMCSE